MSSLQSRKGINRTLSPTGIKSTLDANDSSNSNLDFIPPTVTSTASGNGHFRIPMQNKAEIEDGTPSKSKIDQAKNGKMANPVGNSLEKDKSQFKVDGITNNTENDDEMGIGETEPLNEQPSNDSDDAKGNSTSGSASSTVASKAIMSCINYSFCSVSMIIVNKSLASSYNHLINGGEGLNVLLVVFQAIVAVICVEFCRRTSLIENYPPLTFDIVKSWAPVNLFFCAMLFTGMASLETNSVPMVTVFKNVTNVLTTFGDYIWFKNPLENLVLAAFGIMLIGAVLAAWKDISVTWIGLFWMSMNCISTSGYVLYMKHATQSIKMTKFGMVFANNVLCVVFLLPVAYAFGEVSLFLNTPAIHTVDYTIKNLFAGFVGFFLNFASLNCVQLTGPTTYAIVGSLNKIPVTVLGYFLFDSVITGETWFYICVSLCGGFLYSYAKLPSSYKK